MSAGIATTLQNQAHPAASGGVPAPPGENADADAQRPISAIRGVRDMGMKRPPASPQVYLASSVPAETLAANSQARLRSTLVTLEQCQASLANDAEHDTADLLSVAILQLRMKLKGVTDSELKLLCDAQAAEQQAQAAHKPKAPRGRRRRGRPVLKLVK
jgi:hypothetical protein